MNKRNWTMQTCAMGVAAVLAAPALADQVDSNLPQYEATQGVSGNINTVGSDTMNNLAQLWTEGFREVYPNVRIEIEGMGSSAGPVALSEGTANFAPMSRAMTARENDTFEARHGYVPVALPVAVDMLAVYVHRDNPIEGLSMQQVDGIFSSTQRGGGENITRWGEVGLAGNWANQNISIYGRNAASGTYGFYREHALFGGDFKSSVREQPGSSAVVQGVASERNAIGYSGIGYKTADVRAVPLKQDGDERYYEATAEDAGDYPLARFLYVYVNHQPGRDLDPLRREFIKFMYSQQGQEAVVRDGFIPVSASVAREALKAVGIEPGF
ncbi:PstS family phosphate ABC transporter substrate-binding protein [Phycisphaerales bacterium AB-hyl4]|uniref:Phosphate-binding protein n=1 Tax=Natronomicrosphaera hydrolytica TaxID=3242702 RepID=A0ABV4UC96_9BACT